MLRQIKLLSKVQLVNLLGLNEVRYTKDKGKQKRFLLMAAAWLIVLVMLMGYVIMTCYGYVMLNMAQIIPIYLFTVSSLLMLFFTFFKAGSIIYQMKSYEMLVSLPVSGASIVISRFLTMYVTNFFLGLLIMLPGMAVYGCFQHPGPLFYIFGVLGVILLPFLPITIATALGTGIMALTAKMRNKSLISAILMIVVVLAVMAGNLGFYTEVENIEKIMENLVLEISQQLGRVYPPGRWFANAVLQGDVLEYIKLLAVSGILFVLLIGVLQKHFLTVCTALNATFSKDNYKMKSLSTSSVTKALWKKEIKRYFASSIYVTNTVVGYVLMAVMAVALFFMGTEKLEASIQMPGIIENFMPLVLAVMAVIMPVTACSISMEGKNRWQLQTLPVKSRDIWAGKILLNLTVAAPFYVIAVVFSILALKPTVLAALWIACVPAAYILFSSVLGITINLAMPIFDWENETRVVKQSASAGFTMLAGFLSILPPVVCVLLFRNISLNWIFAGTVLVLFGTSLILYHRNAKKQL